MSAASRRSASLARIAEPSTPGPGAPRQPAERDPSERRPAAEPAGTKQALILEAATHVFLRSGYASASMDAIARQAGVSKRTIYSHFGSKEALFATIIRTRCAALLGALTAPEAKASSVHAVLRALARRFLEVILSPTSLALHRVVVSEAPRRPQLGAAFYRTGPAVAAETLAAYLEDQARQGRLEVAHPRLAAEQFFSMLLGHMHLRALLGVGGPPSEEELAAAIEAAVSTFLSAYGRAS